MLDAIKEHGGIVTVITQTLMVCIWLVIPHMVKVLTGGGGPYIMKVFPCGGGQLQVIIIL